MKRPLETPSHYIKLIIVFLTIEINRNNYIGVTVFLCSLIMKE